MDFQKILKSYMTIKTVLLQDGDIVIQEKIYFVLDVKKPRIGEYGAEDKVYSIDWEEMKPRLYL
jgi:hypothetical protein